MNKIHKVTQNFKLMGGEDPSLFTHPTGFSGAKHYQKTTKFKFLSVFKMKKYSVQTVKWDYVFVSVKCSLHKLELP